MSESQKKYNVKSDVKRISYIAGSALMIVLIFCAFSLIFLLPIYLLSKYQPRLYSVVVLAIIAAFLIYLLVRRMIILYQRYGKIRDVLLHLTVKVAAPIFIIFFMLIFEGVIFRLFFGIFAQPIIPIIITTLLNVLVIGLLFLSRRLFFNAKMYLTKQAKANNNEK